MTMTVLRGALYIGLLVSLWGFTLPGSAPLVLFPYRAVPISSGNPTLDLAWLEAKRYAPETALRVRELKADHAPEWWGQLRDGNRIIINLFDQRSPEDVSSITRTIVHELKHMVNADRSFHALDQELAEAAEVVWEQEQQRQRWASKGIVYSDEEIARSYRQWNEVQVTTCSNLFGGHE